MYLRGFSAVNTIPNMTQGQCSGMGGQWSPYNTVNYVADPRGSCVIFTADPASAPAPPPAPVYIDVATNTNTQVSPQISPAFVQQTNPQGSPVTTGAVSSPSQSTGGEQAFQEMLRQMQEEREALINSLSQQSAPQQAAPSYDYIPLPQASNAADSPEEPQPMNYLPWIAAVIVGAVILSTRKTQRNSHVPRRNAITR